GPAADVYGLCATFYELITGTRLFRHDRETEQTVNTRKLGEPHPERPRRLVSRLPWELDTILIGGLEREVSDRYRSAAALQRDVELFLVDKPIEYRRPSLGRRARLFYRRNRTLVNVVSV